MELFLKEIFQNENLWKKYLPNYTFRESQLELVNKIYNSFNNHSCLIAEAGTGTGKTFSYLVPVITYLRNQENEELKILISTETKTLQNQIYFRDIPLLKKILNFDFSSYVCFGSNNYVCSLKLEEYLESKETKQKSQKIKNFINWLSKNSSGILALYDKELPKDFLQNIQRNTEDCLINLCNYYSECFYYIEKEKWKQSKILITNHHLLSMHLLKENILPTFHIAIIDEAHFFPDILRETITESFSFNEFFTLMKKLNIGDILQNQLSNFYNTVDQFLLKNFDLSQETRCKISNSFNIKGLFKFINTLEKLKKDFNTHLQAIHSFFNLSSTFDVSTQKIQKNKKEVIFKHAIEKLDKILYILNQFYDGPKNNYVHYLEKTSNDIRFCIAPIDVGDYIREYLIYKMNSTIFLSATLSTNHNFDFYIKKIGLEPHQVETTCIPSPFNIKNQALVYIPHISEPNSNSYLEECSNEILQLVELTKGKTLILFTSKKNLQQIQKILLNKLCNISLEMEIISQEEGIQKSLQKFLEKNNSILLGLNSFRQGIDIPNHKLKCIILVKLPFSVPSEPIMSSLMEKNSTNGFMDVFFPDMLIKLKQGMGRIIRSEKDKGIICILDSRIYTKSYGKIVFEYLKNFKIYNHFTDLKRDYETLIYES